MSWGTEFQQAAFRGKPFFILSADSEIGRKSVVYEFATRDTAYSVDLGRKTRRFNFQAVVFGAAARNTLLDEFEAPGPGYLVHPWWGAINVVIESVTVREATEEGGIARFDIKAIEVVNTPVGPNSIPDVIQKTGKAAEGLFTSAGKAFSEAAAKVKNASPDVRKAIAFTVGSAVSEMRRVKGAIGSALNVIDETSAQITTLGNTAASLILTPAALASSVVGLYGSIFGAISTVGSAINRLSGAGRTQPPADVLRMAMLRAAAFGANDALIARTTSQRIIEADAHDAFVTLVRAAVIASAAAVVPTIPYDTLDQALGLSTALNGLIDDLEGRVDDDTFASLQDVRATTSAFLENASGSLPLLSEYTPIDTTPALVVAYLLYADANRDADIIARNNIANPLVIPGGTPLQVIIDA